jgi:hypothetical protein
MSASKRQRVLHYLKAQLGLLTPAAGRFEQLPVELVEAIATNMDRWTLSTFRRTCSYIARCTDYHFRREYLSTFRTDLSTGSLRRLKKRVQDPEYAQGIRTLVLEAAPGGAKEYGRDPTFPVLGDYCKWLRDADGQIILDQESVTKWQDMIRQLPNSRFFRLAGDLPNLRRPNNQLLGTTDASRMILHIIKALQIPVISFDVGIRWLEEGSGTDLGRCNVGEFLDDASFKKAWANLKSFTITGSTPSAAGHPATKMILAAKNLKQLTIGTSILPDFILQELSANGDSLNLEEIQFVKTDIFYESTDEALGFLLTQRKSLKRLEFHDTVCHKLWADILGPMKAAGFPALEKLTFECCYHADPNPRWVESIVVSGACRKLRPGKSELTRFRWTQASNFGEPSGWAVRGPGAPTSVYVMEEMADLAHW